MNNHRYPKEKYDNLNMPNGDMSDVSYSAVSSHLVKTIKDTKCVYCFAPIPKGDFALSEKGFIDRKPYLVHYCMDCVDDIIDGQEGKIDYAEIGYNKWAERYEKYTQAQREYEAAVEMTEYCARYEPTYNPEDGSM